jgi:hypothetical protein
MNAIYTLVTKTNYIGYWKAWSYWYCTKTKIYYSLMTDHNDIILQWNYTSARCDPFFDRKHTFSILLKLQKSHIEKITRLRAWFQWMKPAIDKKGYSAIENRSAYIEHEVTFFAFFFRWWQTICPIFWSKIPNLVFYCFLSHCKFSEL